MHGNAFVGDDAWHHVAVTVDPEDMDVVLYADGVVDETAAFTVGSLATPDILLIGASGPSQAPTSIFDGLMDEIEIFRRALDPGEIQAIYTSGSAGKCKCTEPPDDMLAWWPLDTAFGATKDIAGGHATTTVGSPLPEPDGKVAEALRLDPGHLETPGAPFDFGTSDFTIDAWVKYTSGASLTTPVGTMRGSYQMVAADGREFDAPIPPFTLSVPRTLH